MPEEKLILVDADGKAIGEMEKMEVHRKGLLHRAFSVFLFNRRGEMLLQQRAAGKYHSGGLWSNACCSHPAPGEATAAAARRRLREELGVETPLRELFHFTYRADFDSGLVEHEFDHVFVGEYEGKISPNPEEVAQVAWKSIEEIRRLLAENPQHFTAWFVLAFPRIEEARRSGTIEY